MGCLVSHGCHCCCWLLLLLLAVVGCVPMHCVTPHGVERGRSTRDVSVPLHCAWFQAEGSTPDAEATSALTALLAHHEEAAKKSAGTVLARLMCTLLLLLLLLLLLTRLAAFCQR